jgi:hypothetical protein
MKRHGKSSKIKEFLDASFDLKTVYIARKREASTNDFRVFCSAGIVNYITVIADWIR